MALASSFTTSLLFSFHTFLLEFPCKSFQSFNDLFMCLSLFQSLCLYLRFNALLGSHSFINGFIEFMALGLDSLALFFTLGWYNSACLSLVWVAQNLSSCMWLDDHLTLTYGLFEIFGDFLESNCNGFSSNGVFPFMAFEIDVKRDLVLLEIE